MNADVAIIDEELGELAQAVIKRASPAAIRSASTTRKQQAGTDVLFLVVQARRAREDSALLPSRRTLWMGATGPNGIPQLTETGRTLHRIKTRAQ